MRHRGAGIVSSSGRSLGAASTLKDELVGTWMAVSWEQKKNDGTTLQQFGASPAGMAVFDAGGRYVITVMRSDRAKNASSALWQGTAEENTVTANGTQTYFGTYSVNEADHSIAIHVAGSSFPNWNGTDQKRFVAITGDRLTLTIRPLSGEVVDVVWTRAK
ncbi:MULTISPECIES: lipocalin-like domain-containing protein [Bradyrhizobium]|uniref:lipocalin-like domain-containing protein n=1 Tax=Bradyrhizobium TaxID=374 RepID=UPI001EDA03A6|nr:lipocalin-like domain-containing protein [Bradyrhizobium zhengyangense]MCG2644733.1 lipocalin-like domain-containing protein [Bradyrhizobium zhengyangense]